MNGRDVFKKWVRSYALFLGRNPFKILILSLLVTVVAAHLQSTLEIRSTSNQDFLPEDRPVVVAFDKIGAEFGGLSTITVAVEADPSTAASNEVRDNLDPRMVAYAWTLHQKIAKLDDVQGVDSAADLMRQGNGGALPKSIDRAQELWASNPLLDQYLSQDHTLLLVRVDILPDLEEAAIYDSLDAIVKDTQRPPGVNAFMVGEIPGNIEVNQFVEPDMQRVMSYTMMGIIVVVFIVMGNMAYGILPLFTIIFGTIWSMGMWAGLGQNLTAETSGVSSMIMGIGIDFGIQTISRFRQELARLDGPEEAIAETMANVVLPMSTTTIAALVGFRAMAMGELSFLGQMGSIMSLGVLGCFLAAITIVPALIVIYVRHISKVKIKEVPGWIVESLRF